MLTGVAAGGAALLLTSLLLASAGAALIGLLAGLSSGSPGRFVGGGGWGGGFGGFGGFGGGGAAVSAAVVAGAVAAGHQEAVAPRGAGNAVAQAYLRALGAAHFPAACMDAIAAAVTASERSHTGQIMVAVEADLPLEALWRGHSARQRAEQAFAQLRTWDTEANNGVLIYLLLADHAIGWWQTAVCAAGCRKRAGQRCAGACSNSCAKASTKRLSWPASRR